MEVLNELEYLRNHVKKIYTENDPAHDFAHIMRVYKNAEKIWVISNESVGKFEVDNESFGSCCDKELLLTKTP